MPDEGKALSLPFDEAIRYFRGKVNLPTRTWRDLWEGMHSRAFVVAGAMKSDLLSDLRAAVDKGIADGTTIREFRKDFDGIIAKHGWKYKGGKGWRTAVIFNTNVSVAYHAGHYRQMTDPAVLRARPFFRYVASSSAEPRPEHTRWYNLVLPADDPFWETHYPPNGWGCKCGVVSHSAREVERLREEEKHGPNPIKTRAPKQTHYEWTNPDTGEIVKVPTGIDPGWAYNPGKTAWGKNLSMEAMAAWKAQGAKAWKILTPGNWETAGRSEMIPADVPMARPGSRAKSTKAAASMLKEILGGEEKIFSYQSGTFRYEVLVNAESFAGHMDLSRSAFLPLLPESLEDPYEVWLSFERHRGTGKVVLRQRIIKGIQLEKERGVLIVAQTRNGLMEAWTMIPTTNFRYLNNQRHGKLIWAR